MVNKIINATGGNYIKERLLEHNYEVIKNVNNQEELLEVLNKSENNILILSDCLVGYYSKYALIKKIRDISKKIKILMIMEEMDENFEKYLLDNGIEDFFNNGDFYFEDIIARLNEYEEQKKRDEQKILIEKEKKIKVEERSLITLNTQNVFAVAGNSGCGKSMFTYLYSTYLAKKGLKVLVIDLDTEKGDINIFYNILTSPKDMEYELPKEKASSLNYLVDMIDKGSFTEYNFQKCTIKKDRLLDLDIITGNTSLNVCLNTLTSSYYEKILEIAKLKYDVIFLDTSSSLFLDSTQFSICNSTDIFFVLEPNKLSIERAKRTLTNICDNWNIAKDKIKILVNKHKKSSIEKDLVKRLLREYQVIGFLPFNEDLERIFFDALPDTPRNIKDEFIYISEKLGFSKKVKMIDRLFL